MCVPGGGVTLFHSVLLGFSSLNLLLCLKYVYLGIH